MKFHIKKWFGRTGNQLKSIANLILKENVSIEDVSWVQDKNCILKPIKHNNGKEVNADEYYYITFKDSQLKNILINQIKPKCLIKKANIPDNVFVCHIRSGDAFVDKPHKGIRQPSLSYYKSIIERENINPKNFWVFTQNDKNPVTEHLRRMGCKIMGEDVKQSISIITNAKNFVSANSTFSKYMILMSENVEKIYYPVDSFIEFDPTLPYKIIKISAPGYLEGPWMASKKQLEEMITYPQNKLKFSE